MSRNRKVRFNFYMDIAGGDYDLEVECVVYPGHPGRGPSMENAGGDPEEPAEVDVISVACDNGTIPEWMKPALIEHLNQDRRFNEAAVDAVRGDECVVSVRASENDRRSQHE